MKQAFNFQFFVIILFFLFNIDLFSQAKQITGNVTDTEGNILVGVNVIIKGTTIGTITDSNGKYNLKVTNPNKSTLVFSFVGFETKEVLVSNKNVINVQMKSSFTELEEVVAVGYGTSKKRDLTGSVVSVSNKEMKEIPTPNVALAMAGKVAGVQITSSEGSPDSGIKIRVRGGGSITQDNSPLYIIDGFPSDDGIDYIDPSDIESIDILKDASSAAIYGARGANGVIIITTKGGKIKKTTINFDAYYGIKTLSNKMDMMEPYDFVKLQYENHDDDDEKDFFKTIYGEYNQLEELYGNRKGVDWQDEVFGDNATIQNYKLSVNGGNKKSKYDLSISRNDNQGIMVNSGFERNTGRLKLDQNVNEFIDARVSVRYTEQKTYGMGTSELSSYFNKMTHIARYRPTIGIKGNDEDLVNLDEDPALADEQGNVMQNPLVSAMAEHREKTKKITSLNGSLNFKLAKGLTGKVEGGINNYYERRDKFDGSRSVTAKRVGKPFGSIKSLERRNWTYAVTLNYKTKINKIHNLNFLVGHERVDNYLKVLSVDVKNFPNDDIRLANISIGTPSSAASNEDETRLISFFGRANYSLLDRYIFTMTMRADGSSKFGPDNKYGYFPSASAAWRISEENFMKSLDYISNLKLRLSYGVSGNNRIPNYGFIDILDPCTYGFNNTVGSGVCPKNLANNKLKWESTYSTNLGVDVGFLRQRISLSADLYLSRTKDLLLNANVPYTVGFRTMLSNIGETENKGLELSLRTTNIVNDNFRWTTNFNISFNKNKVIKLAKNETFMKESSGWFGRKMGERDYIIRLDEPIGQMYGYVWDGLYTIDDFDYDSATKKYTLKNGIPFDKNDKPEPGWRKFKDISGPDGKPDGKIDSHDRKVIGNANPIHFGGMTNTFNYKNWELSVFINWSYGNDIYNANKIYYMRGFEKNRNVLSILKDRWTNTDANGNLVTDPNTLAELNKNAIYPVWKSNVIPKLHTNVVEDGSFIRLNNITLAYNVPKNIIKKIKLSSLRVYATANNLYLWTNYSGFDPEVSTRGNSLTPGVDWGAYPRSKTFIFGVNIKL